MPVTLDQDASSRDFDEIVAPWIEDGYRLAVTLLVDPHEARDAVQEAAVRAWRSLGRLREPRLARTWFLAIVANQCRSTMRRRWWKLGRNPLNEAPVDAKGDDVEQSVDIQRGMLRLSPEDRAILHLRFYQDLSLEEIAAVFGISRSAAKVRIFRAARRLRPQLTEEDVT
jgi:RNA polymerase sigma-70 factor (ECF subfamily)